MPSDVNFLSGREALEVEVDIFNSMLEMGRGLKHVDLNYLIDNSENMDHRVVFMAAADLLESLRPYLG